MMNTGMKIVSIMTEEQRLGCQTNILSALSHQSVDCNLVRYSGQLGVGVEVVPVKDDLLDP